MSSSLEPADQLLGRVDLVEQLGRAAALLGQPGQPAQLQRAQVLAGIKYFS